MGDFGITYTESCSCPIQDIGPDLGAACTFGGAYIFMMVLRKFIQGRCDLADPCHRFPPDTKPDDTYDFIVVGGGTAGGVVAGRLSANPAWKATKGAANLADPCHRFPPDTKPDETYDFIVVGGGTAGGVVAGRLSANPAWKVLVLEAGGDEPPISSVPAFLTSYWGRNDTDWNYSTEPTDRACLSSGGVCHWPRAKMLGGTATFNGMMYMRGHSADYDGWAVNGAKGWSWDEVFPYFLMSEDNKQIGTLVSRAHHNMGGPMPVQQFRYNPKLAHSIVAASINIGYPPTTDLNGDNITGFAIAQAFNDNGSRYTTSRGYLRPNRDRKNLHVVFNAHVARVIIDPVTKKATGVEYLDTKNGNAKKVVKASKEVILSGGTMNSPHILLLSGIGPRDTLNKFNIPTLVDLPGVGQNLHNHVGVDLSFLMLNTGKTVEKELTWGTATQYLLSRNGPLSATGMSQLTGIVNTKYAPAGGRHPDVQMFFRGKDASCSDGIMPEAAEEDVPHVDSLGISVVNLQPKSRGYMTIQSVDPMTKPIFQPNYFLEERDVDVLVEGAKIAYRLANDSILKSEYGLVPNPDHGTECGDPTVVTDEFLRCMVHQHTAPEHHQVGTCKMGDKSDPMAVVDTELKVHGVEGLRVIDASIMPVVTTGNTMTPTVMIGERGANFIITRHQRSKTPGGLLTTLGNRFGSGESADNDKDWKYSNFDSSQKDDKLTEQNQNQWPQGQGNWPQWNHGNKPWNHDGHRGWQHWDHQNIQHDPEWHRKHDAYRTAQ